MLNDKILKILATSFVAIFTSSISLKAMEINQISSFQIGKGEGYAEMIRYHPESKSLLVTASETGTVERISISDPFNLKKLVPFDLSGGNVTAVAVHKNLIAASIKEKKADTPGNVKIFNNKGEK